MNFYQFDPIASHGIDVGAARRNPKIVPVRFRDIIQPEHYEKFRWQFFRVHFQFVMANELPNAYDFFMIVCGPVPLSARMAVPDAALDVATGDSGGARIGPGKGSKRPRRRPQMPPIWAKWNLPPAAAVEKPGFSVIPRRGTESARRVGFGGRFGVKLAVLWAGESGLPLTFDGSKHFK